MRDVIASLDDPTVAECALNLDEAAEQLAIARACDAEDAELVQCHAAAALRYAAARIAATGERELGAAMLLLEQLADDADGPDIIEPRRITRDFPPPKKAPQRAGKKSKP